MTIALLMAHAISTSMMAGVIWTMQLVHYPLFARVGADVFPLYQREHMCRISWIVGPAMLVEAASATWLMVDRPRGVPAWAAAAGLALVCAIWLSTALLQGPTHGRLLRHGADAARIRFLVTTNWLRTVAWSARAPLALLMLTWGSLV